MKTDEKIAALVSANPFIATLAHVEGGAFVTECTEKIGQVIAAVKRTGTKGKLVIELAVVPDDKGEVRTVDIFGEAKPKLPVRKKRGTTFFVVGEQSLTRDGVIDDEQPQFDFEAKADKPPAIAKMPQGQARAQGN